ncbi:Clavaminate synthase-like protein, partial [Lepidopterella palustris CBS 459.81]
SYSTNNRFHPVETLHSLTTETFRNSHFTPGTPVLIRKHFLSIPAISKWFNRTPDKPNFYNLNTTYLDPFASTIVPLELTRPSPPSTSSAEEPQQNESFERFDAPLALFLSFASISQPPTTRLYLAQCFLDALPSDLQSDLPTPELVLQAGRGDIYATSLWLGRPPTRTPLHRDPNPNLFVQLAGRKVVRLMEPSVGRAVYERVRGRVGHANMRGEEMMAGEEMKGLEAAVWGNGMEENGWEAELESGDGLFIPMGWWHSVRGIGDGVTGSVNWWFR